MSVNRPYQFRQEAQGGTSLPSPSTRANGREKVLAAKVGAGAVLGRSVELRTSELGSPSGAEVVLFDAAAAAALFASAAASAASWRKFTLTKPKSRPSGCVGAPPAKQNAHIFQLNSGPCYCALTCDWRGAAYADVVISA